MSGNLTITTVYHLLLLLQLLSVYSYHDSEFNSRLGLTSPRNRLTFTPENHVTKSTSQAATMSWAGTSSPAAQSGLEIPQFDEGSY